MRRLLRTFAAVGLAVAAGRLAPRSVWPAASAPPAAAADVGGYAAVGGARCEDQFPGGRWPSVEPAVAKGAVPVCREGWTALWSPLTRDPVLVAERLDGARVGAARRLDRRGSFHEEAGLPAGVRASLGDYAGSGYDRGHMAPSGDMPDRASQEGSYSLADAVPQDRDSNRRLWEWIEAAVRGLAAEGRTAWVVTGPGFGAGTAALGSGVRVPDFLWKAVAVEGLGTAAYVAPNAPGEAYEVVSDDELRRRTGVDPFPGLDAATRSTAAALPPPRRREGAW